MVFDWRTLVPRHVLNVPAPVGVHGDGAVDQLAFPVASEIRTRHAAAPVGSLIPEKLPVPATSSL